MKKNLISISIIFLVGCSSSNDTLLQDQNELPQSKNELLSAKSSIVNKGVETVLMDINISNLFNPENGGCSFTDSGVSAGSTYKSTACFGPIPLQFLGYTVRGYGKPRTHYSYWAGIHMDSGNTPKTVINRGKSLITNDPLSTALSIEFPFQANLTYEIALNFRIRDNIANRSANQSAGIPASEFSEGNPTIAVELKDTPEIPGDSPCSGRPVVGMSLSSANYYKTLKLDETYKNIKTVKFNFSTTAAKNAFLIYFLPELSENRASDYVSNSWHAGYITKIKITQKPYDPQYYIDDYRPVDNDGRAGSIR